MHGYAKLFLSTLFFVDHPKRILIIGLGGGSVQKALNRLLPNAYIDTVELNQDLPALVQQYFHYQEDKHNKIFIQDGIDFVKEVKPDQYDIILLDAFDKDYIPSGFLTDEFMQNVKNLLTHNGVIAINSFAKSKLEQLESSLFKNNFGDYYNMQMNNSRIMLASKHGLPELDQVRHSTILWHYRFAEIECDANRIFQLIKSTSQHP
ncbi:MAG: spermidine synthase [Rickettsiaceae bacterium]